MSYISRFLLSGEQTEYRGSISWWYFAPSFILLAAGAAALICGFALNLGDETSGAVMAIGALILIYALFRLINNLFYKWTSDFVVTDKRCILKTGLISITVSDIALDKCEGIIFRQSIWGRIFGFGTLSATTGGQTLEFPGVASPSEFRNRLFIAMDRYKKTK